MNAPEIKELLKNSYAFRSSSIFIPEYTWGDLRIDALVLDTRRRWIRGFEIKISRNDFLQDDKWVLYSEFCSSLSIVCPAEVIQPSEIKKPFGLMWVEPGKWETRLLWKKKPIKFQKRNSLAWFWTYTNVLEKEIIRMDREMAIMKRHINDNNLSQIPPLRPFITDGELNA